MHKTRIRNAFTLVELLAVITLLGVLAIIVIPNIDKVLKNSKDELYSKQLYTIEVAAKLWATSEENSILLEDNEVWPYVITLADLQASGLIDKDIRNPKTDGNFSENLLIYIDKGSNKYTYSVNEETNDPLAPVITLSGDTVIEKEIVNDIYNELGAIAVYPNQSQVNADLPIIKQNGRIVGSIDNTKVGTYILTYSATYTDGDGNDHTGTAIRILRFKDTTKPIITCNTCINNAVIESNNDYDLPTVTVTDNSGEDIKAMITGSFSSKIPGIKKVVYQATDSSGNTGTYELTLQVKDTHNPTFTYSATMRGPNLVYEVLASDNGSGLKEYSFDGGNTWQKSNMATFPCSNKIEYIAVRDNALNETIQKVDASCSWDYAYTNSSQTFESPLHGWYKVEVWGAQGGDATSEYFGGLGSYASGVIELNTSDTLYINVGGQGAICTATSCAGGYNGGGDGVFPSSHATYYSASGGGATDIRYNGTDLKNRIMVAAGGGGGYYASTTSHGTGGSGGGLYGLEPINIGAYNNSTDYPARNANAGTQSAGGCSTSNAYCGAFGQGGTGAPGGSGGSGGGAGYYGGSGASLGPGAGGSSYISGASGVNSVNSSGTSTNNTIHHSNKYFIDTQFKSGDNEGNGKVKITYVSNNQPEKTNSRLDGIKYIKNCINGSSANDNNHWVELQAIFEGVNVALNKTVTGSKTVYSGRPYSRLVDGDISSALYTRANEYTGNTCLTVDLGQTYNLDEITVWHYWAGSSARYYKNNVTSVSADNSTWTVIFNEQQIETFNGIKTSAYSK